MKKVLLASVVALAASTSTFAVCSNSSGFHAGLRVGLESAQSTVDQVSPAPVLASNQKNSAQNFLGELFAGYNAVLNNFLVGGQIFIGTPSGNNKLSTAYGGGGFANTTLALKRGLSLGANVTLGAALSKETLAYVKLGFDYAKWTLTESSPAAVAPAVAHASFSHPFSKSKLGFSPAIGMSTMLTKNVFLSAEYKYTFWGKMDRPAVAVALPVPGALAARVKINTQTFMVGVGYKF